MSREGALTRPRCPSSAARRKGQPPRCRRAGAAGTLAPSATVKARLLNRLGAGLVDLPVTMNGGRYETGLTIASVGRGDYVVEITAASGAAHAKALVPIRVK